MYEEAEHAIGRASASYLERASGPVLPEPDVVRDAQGERPVRAASGLGDAARLSPVRSPAGEADGR
ncbi:hypothetical protein ACQP1V_13505 [Microtetraspora malaysiensis]|uniref:hypothetical protein n=1 Tax=Microtetraspora malaysiensis TaxID=161358 RepID=UPI003D8A6987